MSHGEGPASAPLTSARRLWAGAQATLAIDAVLWPAAGLAGGWRTVEELAGTAPPVVGAALCFIILAILALRVPAAGARRWFWPVAAVPGAGWVPALPFVAVAAGPPLGTAVGLALLALGLAGSVALVALTALAVTEAPPTRPIEPAPGIHVGADLEGEVAAILAALATPREAAADPAGAVDQAPTAQAEDDDTEHDLDRAEPELDQASGDGSADAGRPANDDSLEAG